MDTVIFGVSRDDVLSHAAFRDEHGLTVQLLADTEEEVCKLYDVLAEKSYEGATQKKVRRSTFVIDKKGYVRHILSEVNPRNHADEVLKVVKTLGGPAN